jgi:hypothetical protein
MTSTDTDKTENASNGWVAIQSQFKELEDDIQLYYSEPGTLEFDVGDGEKFSIRKSEVIQLYSQCSMYLEVLTAINNINDRTQIYIDEVSKILQEAKSQGVANKEYPTWRLRSKGFIQKFLAIKIAQVIYTLYEIVPLADRIEAVMPDAVRTLATLNEESNENTIGEAKGLVFTIKRHEEAATFTLDNIKSIAGKTEALHTKIFAESTMIDEALNKLRGVDDHLAKANEKIDGLLANASKIGLAKSFQDRRIILEEAQKQWRKLFVGGIALIFLAVFLEQFIIQKETALTINAVLTRMLLAAPMVWLTWFAARQFGNNARLIEDYAFKESSALAYHGYKNEFLGDQDHETLTVLRKVAAENFGANPTRMLPGQEAASPLHELLEGALKKEGFDKIVTVLNALNPKAKGDDSAAKKDDKKDA